MARYHAITNGTAIDDGDFSGGADQFNYDIDMVGANGKQDITVELLYLTLSYTSFVDRVDTNAALVNQFKDM